jgi:beta-N-acetylhexosaminidase
MRARAIFGCTGTALASDERAFFRETQPWGFILFARNVHDRDQIRSLVASLRETVGDDRAPVLIDQEGGRVSRLKPPGWKERPPAARFGKVYGNQHEAGVEACYLNARLTWPR